MSLSKAMQELEEQHDLIRQKLRSAFNDKSRLIAELAASQKECERLRKDSERWAYWKPRLIAADFEWGQFKEPVLVFSLNCKISADIDKSTDEAIAAIAEQEPNK